MNWITYAGDLFCGDSFFPSLVFAEIAKIKHLYKKAQSNAEDYSQVKTAILDQVRLNNMMYIDSGYKSSTSKLGKACTSTLGSLSVDKIPDLFWKNSTMLCWVLTKEDGTK